jgi:membrane protein YdbS with pleckstrin-like domain
VTNRIDLPGAEWNRVSTKLIWVDLVRALFFTLVAAAVTVVFGVFHIWWGMGIAGVIAVILLVNTTLVPRRVRALGYQLRDDDLLFKRGIMWQRFVAVPYGRMQLIDINRGPIARPLGLSELKFVTAAATAGVTIPGLPEADADALRDRLVALAESRRAGL